MLQDFKAFLFRGNVLDLAVGLVVGAAFGAIVTSFVGDLLMPPIGYLLGGVNFNDLFLVLGNPVPRPTSVAAAKAAGVATINYGTFLNTVINFVILSFAVFVMVRAVYSLIPRTPPAPTRSCPRCTSGIAVGATKCPHCTADLPASA
jgi:large conductance mechanosensitive channel